MSVPSGRVQETNALSEFATAAGEATAESVPAGWLLPTEGGGEELATAAGEVLLSIAVLACHDFEMLGASPP